MWRRFQSAIRAGTDWYFEPAPFWHFWKAGSGPAGGIVMGLMFWGLVAIWVTYWPS
jgi:hypothetical protein